MDLANGWIPGGVTVLAVEATGGGMPAPLAQPANSLSITDFGRAVLRHEEDFSRHNPIDRWWDGTHLTSDRMWRWNPTLMKP